MNRFSRTLFAGLALVVVLASSKPAWADPILDIDSRRINFQALLRDTAGHPLPGPSVSLRFTAYTSAGAAVGAAINMPVVPITNGVDDVQVAVPASSFDGAGRTLGVSVNGGAELAPRTPLVAVPYAYRVDRVESAELADVISLGS